jgi:hypothetical protein
MKGYDMTEVINRLQGCGGFLVLAGVAILLVSLLAHLLFKVPKKEEAEKNTLWVQKPFFSNFNTETNEWKTAQIGLEDGGKIVWRWTPEAQVSDEHDLSKPIELSEDKK